MVILQKGGNLLFIITQFSNYFTIKVTSDQLHNIPCQQMTPLKDLAGVIP